MNDKNLKANEFEPTKAQLRRLRYEASTHNKVCTVRAHVVRHSAIKQFAKTGGCIHCIKNSIKLDKNVNYWKTKLYNFKNIPKWSDDFTKRDFYIGTYCFIFSCFFYQVSIYAPKLVNWWWF